VTVAVARSATDHDHQLVDGYARYCQELIDAGMISDRARRDGCAWPDSSLIDTRIRRGG